MAARVTIRRRFAFPWRSDVASTRRGLKVVLLQHLHPFSGRSATLCTTIVFGLFLACLAWPGGGSPLVGLDPSWHAALHLAAEDRVRYGSELVWTYGPLGFLAVPEPYFGRSSLAAMVTSSAIQAGACVLLLTFARRSFPLAPAFGIAYLGARAMTSLGIPEMMVAVAFFVGVEMVRQGRTRSVSSWFIATAGAFAGLALLGKINTGIVVMGIGLIASMFAVRPWWRGTAVYLSTALGAVLAGWLVSGQRIEDLIPYVILAADIVTGYSAAMGVEGGQLVWQLFAAGICIAVLVAVGKEVSSGWPSAARLGLVLIGVVLAFASWKTGFTRWHYQLFFATAVLAVFPLMLNAAAARVTSWAFVAMFLAYIGAVGADPVRLLDPFPSLTRAVEVGRLVLDNSYRALVVESERAQMQAAYALSPEALEHLARGTVHIDALETGVLWAYPELEWAPVPAFQVYQAYTPGLDAANARALASAGGPDFLIREPIYAIDGRNPWWETPQAILQMVCRYREVLVAGRWQIVERGDSRCGEERQIGETRARTGDEIEVPASSANQIVVARIHGLEPLLEDRIATLLLRGPEWRVTVNGTQTFRLVPGHGRGPLLMSLPSSVGYTPPNTFPAAITSLSVTRVGDDTIPTDIVVEFFAIEFAGAGTDANQGNASFGHTLAEVRSPSADGKGFVVLLGVAGRR